MQLLTRVQGWERELVGLVSVGLGWVGSVELGGDGHIMVGARSVWAMWSVPVVTMLRSTFFAFGGQESC